MSTKLQIAIEEMNTARADADSANAAKSMFLANVSHELRTPMTSIRAFSEILRDDSDMPLVEKRRYATIIHDEALRLTRLLNDLLDLSVLESGQVSLNMSAGTLNEVLDHAVSTALA